MAIVLVLGAAGGAALRAGWFQLGYLELAVVLLIACVPAVMSSIVDYRRQNLLSRGIATVLIFAAISPFPVLAATWRLGLPAESALPLECLLMSGGAATLGVLAQGLFRWVALVNLLTAAALLAFPGTYPLEIMAGGFAAAFLAVALGLRVPRREGPGAE